MNRRLWFSSWLAPDYDPQVDEQRYIVEDTAMANLVGSYVEGGNHPADPEAVHMPALDIDFSCELRESETPGHFHLLIDKPMPWADYAKLLNVLGEVGILEWGYVDASLERGATYLALHPWKAQNAKP